MTQSIPSTTKIQGMNFQEKARTGRYGKRTQHKGTAYKKLTAGMVEKARLNPSKIAQHILVVA
jgi:hypothetical protein